MTSLEIHQLDLQQLQAAYRQKLFTPYRVCEHLLARIEDPAINCNAFVHVDVDPALQQARESSLRWDRDEPSGPLDGIPVAIKDVLDVAGIPTCFGSAACENASAAETDSIVVQRLRDAGAILLGKTRTWEFAWRSNPDREPQQVVKNPVNQACSPGGSSTGSAAAVAAGLCPIAFGTDSGGSVRGPASFCGVVGLKPGHAMIPVYPPSPMGEIEHIGIFARSVADVRITLDQVGGYHPDDAESWPYQTPLARPKIDLKQLRIGYSDDLNCADPADEVRAHFSDAVEKLDNAGLEMQFVDIPVCENYEDTELLFTPDAALSLKHAPEDQRELADPVILELALQAGKMSALDFANAELVRNDTRRVFFQLFEQIDCLMTLTQETTANRLDQEPELMKLTRRFNMTGQPAISIPAGNSTQGMPIGIQLVCGKGKESLLLSVAETIEELLAAS